MKNSRIPRLQTIAATVLWVGIVAFVGAPVFGDDSMTLRVDDVRAGPGEVVAVVVRTYAPRGVEQGEICVTASSSGGGGKAALISEILTKSVPSPFVALEAVEVFSADGDVTLVAAFDDTDQTALLQFQSPSATVNDTDGPLAIFYFRVSASISSAAEFEIGIDPDGTFLIDADGEMIDVEPRAGRLEVRPLGDTLRLEALDDRVEPGETAEISVETHESAAIASGQVVLTYDPSFVSGTPQVSMDPQHGSSTFTVDTSVAGRVLVAFQSSDSSLGGVPGDIITFHLPTSTTLADGSKSALVLDPALTYLVGSQGQWIALELRDGELEIDG